MIEGQEGLTWDRWKRLAHAAEDLGFDSLWRSDHFFSLAGPRDRQALETWISLVVAAQETKRVRFGPLVCSMTFRQPALLARMAAQIDVLSNGRLEVGVGAGWNAPEHDAFGLPFPSTGTRMDMLEEGVQVMQALWGKGPATVTGRHYTLKEATCYPKPVQTPLPLIIGGTGEKRTLRIAAKYAQHWNAVSVGVDAYPAKRAALERHCAELGRDPNEIHRSMMAGFIIGATEAEVAKHYEQVAEALFTHRKMDQDAIQARLANSGWAVGTTSQVVEQLGALEEVGVQEFMFQHHAQENFGVLELIAKEVIPQVRK